MGFTSAGTHTSIATTTGSQSCLIMADKDGFISSQSTSCPILIQSLPNTLHTIDPFPRKLFLWDLQVFSQCLHFSPYLIFSVFVAASFFFFLLHKWIEIQDMHAQVYGFSVGVGGWPLQGQIITSSQRTYETAAMALKPKQSRLMPAPCSWSLRLSVRPVFPSAYGCSFSLRGREGGKGSWVFTHCHRAQSTKKKKKKRHFL